MWNGNIKSVICTFCTNPEKQMKYIFCKSNNFHINKNKMTNIYSNIRRCTHRAMVMLLPLCGMASLASCDDFLSIKPLNDVVLENYWTEEKDAYSVLFSCYEQMNSNDCIQRMMIWGESRSDNMQVGSGTPNDMVQIFKENILETNPYANWQCFYNVINRCNTVIHYAPEVCAKDPNFTEAELRATIAEAVTLRSLAYFYLIRTFRDVPYVTEPSIDDSKSFRVPACKFEYVLDHIINDVEAVKDDAVIRFGEETGENTYRITRSACYALLADMYLWKGEWQKCIYNCDLVIAQKYIDYLVMFEKNPNSMSVELFGNYPLIPEAMTGSNEMGNAYDAIFGNDGGNSFETIFELASMGNRRGMTTTDNPVSKFYGNDATKTGQIGVPSYLFSDPSTSTNDYFTKTDCRRLENIYIDNNKGFISKYAVNDASITYSLTTGEMRSKLTYWNVPFVNWIVYRLTDVMLMRAEALVELAGDAEAGTSLTETQEKYYRDAFSCVSAVWKRANNKRVATTDTLVFSDYATSRITMEDLVLDERQRELMFEGKRWFDLVRLCMRDGNNARMLSKVVQKFQENGPAIRIKLSTQDILFWPYSRNELKVNPMLKQNPAYDTDKSEKNI